MTTNEERNYLDEALAYVYIAQYVRGGGPPSSGGVLADDCQAYSRQLKELVARGDVARISLAGIRLSGFATTPQGATVANQILSSRLEVSKQRLTAELDRMPKALTQYLLEDLILREERSVSVEGLASRPQRDIGQSDTYLGLNGIHSFWCLLRSVDVLRARDWLLQLLVDAKMAVRAHDYVGTRGGESRDRRFVLAHELEAFARDYLLQAKLVRQLWSPSQEDQHVVFHLLDTEYGTALSYETLELSIPIRYREDVSGFVRECLKEGLLEEVQSGADGRFKAKDLLAYRQRVSERFWKPLVDFLLSSGRPAVMPVSMPMSTPAPAPKPMPIPTPAPVPTPVLRQDIIVGDQKLGAQWGVLGKSGEKRVVLDLNAPHVAFVCGMMGAGKGYTLGVLCEMLAGPSIPNLSHVERPATIIVLYRAREDLPSEFSTISQKNDNAKEIDVLRGTYGVEPRVMVEPQKLRVFIDPFVFQKDRPHFQHQYPTADVRPLYTDPSSLEGQDWSIVLSAGQRTDQLYVKRLFGILEHLQFGTFDMTKLLAEVLNDPVMDAKQKKLAQQRIDVLRNYLAGPAAEDFVRNLAVGGVNVFDFRKTIRTTDDVFSLMTLVISVLQTKKGLEDEPFVFVINEAHDYFKGGVSADFVESIEHLIRRRRHGKNWLLLDTHFPDDVDDRVIQLADLKFVHYLDKATTSTALNRAFSSHAAEFSNLNTGEAYLAAQQSSDGTSQVFRVSIRPRLTKHGGATRTAV